jgi:hypothetical protein
MYILPDDARTKGARLSKGSKGDKPQESAVAYIGLGGTPGDEVITGF